jgi:NADH-quinone oxidoreductase subunit N
LEEAVHVLAQAAEAPLNLPEIDWRAVAPELALAATGLVALLVVAWWPHVRRSLLAGLCLAGLAVSAGLTWWNWDLARTAFEGAVALDGLTRYARLVLLAVGALAVLMAAHDSDRDPDEPAELFPMLMFALTGMVLLAAASDLLVVFIALELLSLSLYVMAGATGRLRAEESAMKYFLLGAFSSAFLLYGIALSFGATRTTNLLGIARAVGDPTVSEGLLLAGVGLLAVGFLFKVAAVPFHQWTPDVYQGAPAPVTAFMAAGTKTAGFAVFLRVFGGALGGLVVSWRPVIAAIAVLTMLLGATLAVVQQDLKRMLAYSSIAHTGYMLVGLAAFAAGEIQGLQGLLFYGAAYAFMNLGAFAVVAAVQRRAGVTSNLDTFAGLIRREPWLAILMTLFLLSLTGIPPTAGFFAKAYVILPAIQASEAGWTALGVLAVITMLNAAIAAFYYLRVLLYMFVREPQSEQPAMPHSRLLWGGLAVASVVTVVLGLVPGFLDVVNNAAQAIGG